MRYHICYSDSLRLSDGSTVSLENVTLKEAIHEYDVGTREKDGRSRKIGEKAQFLEDYMSDGNFVMILEVGESIKTDETKD